MNSSTNGGDMEVEEEEEDEFPSDPIQVLKLSAKTLGNCHIPILLFVFRRIR